MARPRRVVLVTLLLAVGTCGGYLLAWPVDADPEAWTPPPAPPMTGLYAPNQDLASREILHADLAGPEATAVDAQGRLVAGLLDGRIVRFAPDGRGAVETVANTGGRPLGLRYHPDGRLFVADAHKGLVAVGTDGQVEVLVSEHGGKPIRFADDLAIGRDGTVYFSDASFVRSVEQWKLELLEHRPNGRLLAYRPDTKQTELLLGDLYFANGVALGPDDAYVLVNELGSYRVRRVWLTGDKKGQSDTFADNLPGFPDNITYSPTRRAFWVALGSPRDENVDKLAGKPFLRKVVMRLPDALQPKPAKHSWALAFDEQGQPVASLQQTGEAAYAPVASVLEVGEWLYLGSFQSKGIARVKAPPLR